jgi:hypothetical protein
MCYDIEADRISGGSTIVESVPWLEHQLIYRVKNRGPRKRTSLLTAKYEDLATLNSTTVIHVLYVFNSHQFNAPAVHGYRCSNKHVQRYVNKIPT